MQSVLIPIMLSNKVQDLWHETIAQEEEYPTEDGYQPFSHDFLASPLLLIPLIYSRHVLGLHQPLFTDLLCPSLMIDLTFNLVLLASAPFYICIR